MYNPLSHEVMNRMANRDYDLKAFNGVCGCRVEYSVIVEPLNEAVG